MDIETIKLLESQARELEPTTGRRQHLLQAVDAYTDQFLESLSSKKAYDDSRPSPPDRETAIGQTNVPIDDLLDHLRREVDTPGINPASPGHLGYIPGGGLFTSAMADYIAAVTNRYAGLYYASPGAVQLENQMIRWTADLLKYPPEALGNITSGGSMANLIAVTTARDHHGIEADMIDQSVIYYTQQTHHCVSKAVRIAGLGRCLTREVRLDSHFRMDVNDLRRQVENDVAQGLNPFFIAGSMGSTDTGAADPVNAIADIAEIYDIWFHLDAAYGGYFVLVDELNGLFKGVERTDSVALDPHKSLFLPYGIGIVLVKNGEALFHSQHYMANYLQDAYADGAEVSPCDLSPELTKHFRGLRMWLPLKLHGVEPFRAALKEKWLLARYFHKKVAEMGFEVGPEPDLSVVIYRFIPAEGEANLFNQKLIKDIQADGRIFVSSTTIEGIFWLRVAVVCFRTHLEHIDFFLNILKEKTEKLIVSEKVSA